MRAARPRDCRGRPASKQLATARGVTFAIVLKSTNRVARICKMTSSRIGNSPADEPHRSVRFCCSWSGGKDSCLAFYRAVKSGAEPAVLLTLFTEDDERSRSHGLHRSVIAA